jgi:hypothetical protein
VGGETLRPGTHAKADRIVERYAIVNEINPYATLRRGAMPELVKNQMTDLSALQDINARPVHRPLGRDRLERSRDTHAADFRLRPRRRDGDALRGGRQRHRADGRTDHATKFTIAGFVSALLVFAVVFGLGFCVGYGVALERAARAGR